MRKRCTDSKCRKYFRDSNTCPHCGKKYPRIILPVCDTDYYMILCTGIEKGSTLDNTLTRWFSYILKHGSNRKNHDAVIRRIGKATKKNPVIIDKNLERSEAEVEKNMLERRGAKIIIRKQKSFRHCGN